MVFYVHIDHGQIKYLQKSFARRENGFAFRDFSHLLVESIDVVCGINQRSDFLQLLSKKL